MQDFVQRIPRAEVEQHSQIVKEAALQLDPKLEIYTMGSYRRGATTCGDVPFPFAIITLSELTSDRSHNNQTRCHGQRPYAPNDNARINPLLQRLPNALSLPLAQRRRLKMARRIPFTRGLTPALRSAVCAVERTWRGTDLFHGE